MAANQRSLKSGEFLFREGDASQAIYLIKKGSISIRKNRGSGYVDLAKVHSNEILGELSFFDKLPRSASAVAVSEVEVLEIPFENLNKIYATVPDYIKAIVASMADRLRKADETIRKLQHESGKSDDAPSDEPDAAAVLAATAGPSAKPE